MSRTLSQLPGPTRIPGIGNALQIRPSELSVQTESWCRRYGPVFRFDIGRRPVVGIGDPDLINAILRDRPHRFRRWEDIREAMTELGTAGVFAAEGDAWRRQRKLAVMALNAAHLHRYFDKILTASERLHRELTQAATTAEPLAIREPFGRFSTTVTTALAFGRDLDVSANDPDLREHIERVFATLARRISAPVPYWRVVKLPADRAAERSREALGAAVAGFIADARARMQARPELWEAPENFLEGMLAAQRRDSLITDLELFANVMTMLLAGEDTTSNTLAWSTWLLAKHPEVRAWLAAEADEVLGDAVVVADHDATSRLVYAEAVLRESLRLHGTGSLMFIQAAQDSIVGDLEVPGGTRLLLLTRHAATQHEAFERPLSFEPERWLTKTTEGQAHDPRAFLPFGAGPRFCPGRNLAFLEAKVVLSTLARSFDVTLPPGAPQVREHFSFVNSPRGLLVNVRARL